MNKPKYVEDDSHMPLLPMFKNWCMSQGFDNEDDEACNWDCFLAGATAMYLNIKNGVISV